jgi:histone demethylase JARID1
VCISHVQNLCKCDVSKYTLKYRYTLDDLWSMLSKTKQIHEKYNSWCNEIKNMLSCNNVEKKYELNDLKNALKIANENSYTKNSDFYNNLVNAVKDAEDCENIARFFFDNFQENYLDEEKENDKNKMKFNIEYFKTFMNRSSQLPCNLNHVNYLSKTYTEILEFEKVASEVIEKKSLDCIILKKYIDYCTKIKIDLGQIFDNLKSLYEQALWISDVNSVVNKPQNFTLDGINSLLAAAVQLPNQSSVIEKKIVNLQELYCIAKIWDQKADSQIKNK